MRARRPAHCTAPPEAWRCACREGKLFLQKEAAKYAKQAPEAVEALQTLEYMFVLQQAGKSTADLEDYDIKRAWPTKDYFIPYYKPKAQEGATPPRRRS
eukprot:SAG11_NODE_3282_length_2553_cov_1.743684_4_plen_99_part_00